ncbi:MAG: tetraacyldisaccharide 4'-kinase [Bacteroidaceae bacterium]|nr:tetraacyldisaccharide 4'-kinase [Bacteroidaceae bacterium]
MEGDLIKTYPMLTPLSWMYGLATGIRNFMFETGVLKSKSYDVPIINIGNLTAGGTGKTPHTEYLIRLLQDSNQVAVLSRGYKRKSKGFILADATMPMSKIGDEPYQMKHKFPKIHMAVDKNRCHGIEKLISPAIKPEVDVILLDDAYQYRYVQPGVNILLMDYHRLVYYDKLLPAGRLRESAKGKNRADVVIVTKCPTYITPMDKRGIERSLCLETWQRLFFTTYRYDEAYKVTDKSVTLSFDELKNKEIVLVSGIASPEQLEYDLKKQGINFTSIHYSDHHNFTSADIKLIRQKAEGKIILMTEKDAARTDGLFGEDIEKIYALPIEVEFMGDKEDVEFNNIIKSYISKNSRNSILLKKK